MYVPVQSPKARKSQFWTVQSRLSYIDILSTTPMELLIKLSVFRLTTNFIYSHLLVCLSYLIILFLFLIWMEAGIKQEQENPVIC